VSVFVWGTREAESEGVSGPGAARPSRSWGPPTLAALRWSLTLTLTVRQAKPG
jgi:hypothetical protein